MPVKIEFTCNESGRGRLILDGEDISNKVRSVRIEATAYKETSVWVEYAPVIVRADVISDDLTSFRPVAEVPKR
jgi:hypothetical protein